MTYGNSFESGKCGRFAKRVFTSGSSEIFSDSKRTSWMSIENLDLER